MIDDDQDDSEHFDSLARMAARKGWILSVTATGHYMLRRGTVSRHFGDLKSVRSLIAG